MSTLRCPECSHRIQPGSPTCSTCGYRFRYDRFERVLPFMRRPERQWEGRLSFFQRFWAVMVMPAVAFWDIVREPDQRGPALIFFGNLLTVSMFYVAMILHVVDVPFMSLFVGYVGIIIVYSFLNFIWLMLYFGIIHAVVRLSGREGFFSETFLIGQYALFPLLLTNVISLGLLVVGLPPVSINSLAVLANYSQPIWLIIWALTTIASLWGAVLLALAIRERYHLSTGTALVISLTVTTFALVAALFARLVPAI